MTPTPTSTPSPIRRFGVLAPPGNVSMEQELPRLVPAGIQYHHNRLSRPGSVMSQDSLRAMADSVEQASYDLAQAYPEVILYGCTSGSFLFGIGREEEVAQRIAAHTGIPSLTTSTAVIAALRAFDAKRVFMMSPYPDDINLHEIAFLRHYGIEVAGWDAFRCDSSEKIRAVTPGEVVAMAMRHAGEIAACDALFISCTNLRIVEHIERLEADLGKPVVTSNQASLWAVLRLMAVDTQAIAAGSLFRTAGHVPVSR